MEHFDSKIYFSFSKRFLDYLTGDIFSAYYSALRVIDMSSRLGSGEQIWLILQKSIFIIFSTTIFAATPRSVPQLLISTMHSGRFSPAMGVSIVGSLALFWEIYRSMKKTTLTACYDNKKLAAVKTNP